MSELTLKLIKKEGLMRGTNDNGRFNGQTRSEKS